MNLPSVDFSSLY